MGRPGLDGIKITLNYTLVPEGAKFLHLRLADAAARRGESLEALFAGEFLVESDEFAQFVPTGMAMGGFDGRQFEREKNLGLVISQKSFQ